MQVFVRAESNKTFTLDVQPSDTVGQLKAKILEKEGVPIEGQRLVVGGKQLSDAFFLREYNISKEQTVNLMFRLCGGYRGQPASCRRKVSNSGLSNPYSYERQEQRRLFAERQRRMQARLKCFHGCVTAILMTQITDKPRLDHLAEQSRLCSLPLELVQEYVLPHFEMCVAQDTDWGKSYKIRKRLNNNACCIIC